MFFLKTNSLILTAIRNILPPYIVSRVLIFIIIVGVHGANFTEIPAVEERSLHPFLSFSLSESIKSLRCVLNSADARWYAQIAEIGYTPGPYTDATAANWVFFPLYPLSIKLLNLLTGSSLLSGMLISNLAFLFGLVSLQLISHSNSKLSTLVPWIVCFFPGAHFFVAPFSESLYFFLLTNAWLAATKQRYLVFAFCLALLITTRPSGMLTIPAFVFLLWQQKQLFSTRALAALAVAPLGLVGYATYLWTLTGNAMAFRDNQIAWGRTLGFSSDVFTQLLSAPEIVISPWIFNWLSVLQAILVLFCIIFYLAKRQFSYSALLFFPLAVPLLTGTLLSIPRFVLPLFPVYLCLNEMCSNSSKERTLLAMLITIFAILTILYARHITAGMT